MKHIVALLCLIYALMFIMPSPGAWASADGGFTVSLNGSQGRPGDKVELSVSYDGSLGRLDAFLMSIEYDSQCWTFRDTLGASLNDTGYLTVSNAPDRVLAVYSTENSDGCPAGQILTFRFQLNRNAPVRSTAFSMNVTQMVLYGVESPEERAASASYRVLAPFSNEADLLELSPSSGALRPEFSPEITSYGLNVPYNVTSVTFNYRPSAGSEVSVNRRNLGAAGSDTIFTCRVTAEDGITKKLYTIIVHRAEAPPTTPRPTATPKPTNTPKPTATPKPTNTPKPTATPKPAKTPKPTATPKPTNTPKPTATPKPTNTPKPTATPKPTNTPKPTATPKPTKTPKPTATPKPTKTPKPTATPKPTKTPKPTATPLPPETGADISPSPQANMVPVQLILDGEDSSIGSGGWRESGRAIGLLAAAVTAVFTLLALFKYPKQVIGLIMRLFKLKK